MQDDHYSYRVLWSEEDQEYVGTVREFPRLSYLDPYETKALAGIRDLVREVIESGEFDVPEQLEER